MHQQLNESTDQRKKKESSKEIKKIKERLKLAGERSPVGLCTCINPGGQRFQSHLRYQFTKSTKTLYFRGQSARKCWMLSYLNNKTKLDH